MFPFLLSSKERPASSWGKKLFTISWIEDGSLVGHVRSPRSRSSGDWPVWSVVLTARWWEHKGGVIDVFITSPPAVWKHAADSPPQAVSSRGNSEEKSVPTVLNVNAFDTFVKYCTHQAHKTGQLTLFFNCKHHHRHHYQFWWFFKHWPNDQIQLFLHFSTRNIIFSGSAGQIKTGLNIVVMVWTCYKEWNITHTLALTVCDLSDNLQRTFVFPSSCSFHVQMMDCFGQEPQKEKKTFLKQNCDKNIAKELPNGTIDKTLMSSGHHRDFTQPLEVLWLTRTIVLKSRHCLCLLSTLPEVSSSKSICPPVGMEERDSEMKRGRRSRDGD